VRSIIGEGMVLRPVTLGLIQSAVSDNPDENLARMVSAVSAAIERGAEIICLPELFRTRYFPRHIGGSFESLSEPVPGPTTDIFAGIAGRNKRVIIVPVYERTREGLFRNVAVVIDGDGTVMPPYAKTHIPQDPYFFEKGYFQPGSEYRVFETCHGRIAPLICYDQWFPEAARIVSLMGAEIIFYPTAIGDIPSCQKEGEWQDSWETMQRSHAIANGVHVAAINRCGTEGDIRFFGGSFVCDAFGTVLSRAGSDEEILIVKIDIGMNQEIQESWGFFRNRRPETYSLISQPIREPGPDSVSLTLHDTPRNRGYSMPAEWELHDAVWLSWPHNSLTFPTLSAVEDAYVGFIKAVHQSEEVRVLVLNEESRIRIARILTHAGVDMNRVSLCPFSYLDVWIRDYGPTFVVNRGENRAALVRWIFNAWGNKYDELLRDGVVPGYMNELLHLPVFEPGIVLEGGSIDVNGKGTVLTTRACLLNVNRNPSLSEDEIEQYLCEYLGIEKVIWLHDGIAGDDTDGHIDDIARFVGPSTVVCAYEENQSDENYASLRENYEILCAATDQDGNPLTIVPIPMPGPVFDEEGRYPASYLNFYIANGVVVVPVFDDPNDAHALEILAGLFPDRQVIGVRARAMVEGYGTFHCATQQQPRIWRSV